MMRKIGIALFAGAGCVSIFLYGLGTGWLGARRDAGEITPRTRPAAVQADYAIRQDSARAAVKGSEKQILFGDFHVHTTFSWDAFLISLPMLGGEGAHPPADACDFARFCSALDFWSINDHAEGLTPFQWQETRESIRQCDALAGDPEDQDLVSFLGWEWTQVGRERENHYGHKNVILRDIDDRKTPPRPIASARDGLAMNPPLSSRIQLGLFAPQGRRQDYLDFARFTQDRVTLKKCPQGVHVRALPADCEEIAATPGLLYRKLREWGYPALVIPHGTSWGFYTPQGSTFDKQLTERQNDPGLQTLIEVFSGHGNSEQYRDWRAVRLDEEGKPYCPKPSADYLPSCWRAGEIIRARCLKEGASEETCEERALQARQYYAEAPSVTGFLAIPGSDPYDWLDAGQCRDCYLPAFNYRPGSSVQYTLAIGNFDDPENPKYFRFGFIGSSDNHKARAGTGYKEFARQQMTEATGALQPGSPLDPILRREPAAAAARPMDDAAIEGRANFDLLETERNGSFFTTGGLVAVHSGGRNRRAIWDALERREVYGTSGERILLWFDLENAPEGKLPMGSETEMDAAPRFAVRALGAFKQKPGCPDHVHDALGDARVQKICLGECYNPSDERKRITHIEIIRITPQTQKDEPIAPLIQDVWKRIPCPKEGEGCVAQFSDPDFVRGGRRTVYYARAVQEEAPVVNAAQLRCSFNAEGACVSVNPCYGDYRTPYQDDCLANAPEMAWSSPIYIGYKKGLRGTRPAPAARTPAPRAPQTPASQTPAP